MFIKNIIFGGYYISNIYFFGEIWKILKGKKKNYLEFYYLVVIIVVILV